VTHNMMLSVKLNDSAAYAYIRGQVCQAELARQLGGVVLTLALAQQGRQAACR
jgi:hypothetical protein